MKKGCFVIKRLTVFLLAVIVLSAFIPAAQAVTDRDLEQKREEIAQHLLTFPTPSVSSVGGEWMIIGLARSGKLSRQMADGYYANVQSYVRTVGSAKLHRSKSTDNSRLIIALTSIGKDPRDIAGYNLIEPLADFDFVKKQGINGAIWALIALDTMQYEIPFDSTVRKFTTREVLIEEILASQCSDGGWDLNGESADPDVTGMAIQALAPYYSTDEKVRRAVEKALALISANQNSDGSFLGGGENTPESCAQIITALSALNIDCNSDSRFIKNNRSIADSLMSFSVKGGFVHTMGGGYNQMSTEQGYYALVAYNRMLRGKNPLYDMTDLSVKGDIDSDGKATIDDATLIQRYLADLADFSRLQKKLSDLYSDDRITIDDVTWLQRKLAG
ncbi:MAG: hypothetical protein UIH27_14260 [Ruminococcus sp.]|nr:hypothetical protein [Ruminococcus sp.]